MAARQALDARRGGRLTDPTVRRARGTGPAGLGPDALRVINACFEGDVALYRAFATACAQQFARDVVSGQDAADAADLGRLRRLAHDLASVLVMLGQVEMSALATRVEQSSTSGDLAAARAGWDSLRAGLASLALS